MSRIIFIGPIGSDAGGWYIGPDGKIHRYPGWNPETMADLTHALAGIREIAQIKAPGLAERAMGGVLEIVRKEVGSNLKEGDVLVFGH